MINIILNHFLPKRRWRKLLSTHRNKAGYITISIESALAFNAFIQMVELKGVSDRDTMGYYINPPVDSLYDLLCFASNAVISIKTDARMPNKKFHVSEESIRLDIWLRQPLGGEWGTQDVLSAVRLLGDYISTLVAARGDIPLNYFERQMSKIIECYLTIVEIVGDINYGSSEEG